ncbi:hypothetical protein DL98DRAFT_538173 [Cadophora sp. DSE1049]|nr:hypothetical protein DL98DRAFT_538173 [Cadophora sp. DSE1049]
MFEHSLRDPIYPFKPNKPQFDIDNSDKHPFDINKLSTMEGITYSDQASKRPKQQTTKSAAPSDSASRYVPPRLITIGTSYIAPTSKMTRPAVSLKPILPASQAIKKPPPTSAFARAKAKRERMLAKMNDYSALAPDVAERGRDMAEQKAYMAAYPTLQCISMAEGPPTSNTNIMTFEMRPAPAALPVMRRKLPVPKEEHRKCVDYTMKSEQEYLRHCREAQDPDSEDRKNPYLKEYFEDEEADGSGDHWH